MIYKNKLLIILSLTMFLLILIFPEICFNGAKAGLRLWSFSVLPGLFCAAYMSVFIMHLIKPENSLILLFISVSGLLCGFPVAAIVYSEYCKKNADLGNSSLFLNDRLSAEMLLAFCNISGPSFVMNYIKKMSSFECIGGVKLCTAVYLPPVFLVILILFLNYKEKIKLKKTSIFKRKSINDYCNTDAELFNKKNLPEIIDDVMNTTVKNMLKTGGYIVFFSCLSAFICNMPVRPEISAVLCGTAEITNGIYLTDCLKMSPQIRSCIILSINAFGGISTMMQTMSVLSKTKFNIKKYMHYKIILAVFTLAVVIVVMHV